MMFCQNWHVCLVLVDVITRVTSDMALMPCTYLRACSSSIGPSLNSPNFNVRPRETKDKVREVYNVTSAASPRTLPCPSCPAHVTASPILRDFLTCLTFFYWSLHSI
ncbi:unnamed protein product [Protopolystoma xenopodis]|uniref:Secreted protein n=1 Tax=Protopolystoma xenopodis TaxID=117903 RepID=A0A3S5FEA1_9PLAT|nr:unnamed protein product [Protopolystoma xenopodis]